MIDKISISNGQPAMAPPLTFVVVLSMIKDAYEDYKRHREDDHENKSLTDVFNKSDILFTRETWRSLKVGDIVRVNENEFFPADLVIIGTSEDTGVFYVETKNLDGETNLKLKSTSKEMSGTFKKTESLQKMKGVFNIEAPNNRIYKFDGNYNTKGNQMLNSDKTVIPLSNDNVALRGMSLRNTEYVYGVIVYTGHDTKI